MSIGVAMQDLFGEDNFTEAHEGFHQCSLDFPSLGRTLKEVVKILVRITLPSIRASAVTIVKRTTATIDNEIAVAINNERATQRQGNSFRMMARMSPYKHNYKESTITQA